MTRTASVIRAELAAIRQRSTELEAAWLDRTEAPAEELGDLYLQRDQLEAELAELGGEDTA